MISQDLLDILACPVCITPLKPAASDKLQCVNCRRLYPILDGIPLLLESEAQKA
ncbi:MAG: Trm112 family protein [Terriglobales bacterium]